MKNSDAALYEATSIAVVIAGGSFLSLFIAGIGSLALARLLGPEGYGAYSLVLAVPSFLIALVDLGMPASMIRYISRYPERAVRYTSQALSVATAAALTATIAGVFLSSYLSQILINRPEYSELVTISLPYVTAYTILNIVKASLMGLGEKVKAVSLDPLYNILRTSLSISLVPLLFVRGAILGFVIASVISCLVGILVLSRSLGSSKFEPNFLSMRELLSFSLPLHAANLINSVMWIYTTIVLSRFFTDFEIGNYRAALNLLTVISLVISPFSTAFLRVFSEASTQNFEKIFEDSVKYVALISVPLALYSSATSHDLVRVVYGRRYGDAENYFSVVVFANILTLAGSHVVGSALSAAGRTKYILLSSTAGALTYVPLLYVLTGMCGLYGAAVSYVSLGAVVTLTQLYFLKKVIRVSVSTSFSLKVVASSAVPAVLVAHLASGSDFLGSLLLLIAKFTVFVAIYTALLVALRAISEEDIRKLRSLSRALGPLSKVVGIVLKYATLLIRTLQ
ncbi:MAG: oligosaccharide flippase family protein [Sulfolobales archaeon]|nr:oligosaccharide flippase family protein [Sulfolobales archaeon]